MLKSLRFLLQFAWINMAALCAFAVLVTAGCYATGVPDGAENLFSTYFRGFFPMSLIILFLFAFALCTSNLNLALSMGARRRNFFLGVQGMLLLYAVEACLLQGLLSLLCQADNWAEPTRWMGLDNLGWRELGIAFVVNLLVGILGCLSGLLLAKSKLLGGIVMVLSLFAVLAGTLFVQMSAFLGKSRPLLGGIWGDLPVITLAIFLVLLAGGDAAIWRTIRGYIVR